MHSEAETHVPMVSVHLPECLPVLRARSACHYCTHDLRKQKFSCVDIPSNNGSVVADGLRGIVQRDALQQTSDKLIALGV